jgi:RNA polymerase sigma-70 factor, ECF subfamily
MGHPDTRPHGRHVDNVITLGAARADAESAVRAEETALLLRVREQADREAFTRLFTRFAPRLKHYLSGLGCDYASGESIVQDVMIAVWTKAHLFDPVKASARTWIYTLVRNRMIDLRRAAVRETSAFERFGRDHELEHGDGSQLSRAAGVQVATFLEELPPEQARILLMAYVEGRSHREIADELAIPIGTVKSRARLAFQRLRKRMEASL